VRKKVLLRAFGSLERVKRAAFDELAPYVGPKVAAQIIEHFKQNGQDEDPEPRTKDENLVS
jgi:hypothetical protein